MAHIITLPVSGLEVELAVLGWRESKSFFDDAKAFLAGDHKSDDWMEKVLTDLYPKKVLDVVFKAAPDARALYNDTVRYNTLGPEAIKNSLRSGIGAPTQTDSTTAGPAEKATPTE